MLCDWRLLNDTTISLSSLWSYDTRYFNVCEGSVVHKLRYNTSFRPPSRGSIYLPQPPLDIHSVNASCVLECWKRFQLGSHNRQVEVASIGSNREVVSTQIVKFKRPHEATSVRCTNNCSNRFVQSSWSPISSKIIEFPSLLSLSSAKQAIQLFAAATLDICASTLVRFLSDQKIIKQVSKNCSRLTTIFYVLENVL